MGKRNSFEITVYTLETFATGLLKRGLSVLLDEVVDGKIPAAYAQRTGLSPKVRKAMGQIAAGLCICTTLRVQELGESAWYPFEIAYQVYKWFIHPSIYARFLIH